VRTPRLILAAAAAAVLALAGCGQMELTPQGDPSRVLNGEVSLPDASSLPQGATVTVRIVEPDTLPPVVLGSQTITDTSVLPVAFHVPYRAEDDLLLHGLNIDVRVSVGGRVQYYNRNRYAVSLGNATDTHRITVDRSGP
jgi:uncharacterized lipoprotein YbaY